MMVFYHKTKILAAVGTHVFENMQEQTAFAPGKWRISLMKIHLFPGGLSARKSVVFPGAGMV